MHEGEAHSRPARRGSLASDVHQARAVRCDGDVAGPGRQQVLGQSRQLGDLAPGIDREPEYASVVCDGTAVADGQARGLQVLQHAGVVLRPGQSADPQLALGHLHPVVRVGIFPPRSEVVAGVLPGTYPAGEWRDGPGYFSAPGFG